MIAAQALGLRLEELILLYEVQFPVLQQNEDDTWYDRYGRIVFTCSKGLSGVGLDRKEWNAVRDMTGDETRDETRNETRNADRIQNPVSVSNRVSAFPDLRSDAPGTLTQTIRKSELYEGEEVTYVAPFDRCDRVEDYKAVWRRFDSRKTLTGF